MMKRFQRGLVVSMAAAFLMTSTLMTTVLATSNQNDGIKSSKVENTNEQDKDATKDISKAIEKIAKEGLEAEKAIIEEQKDKLEEQKEILETQYEAAKTRGNIELAKQIQTQIQKIKADMETLKQQMKQKKEAIKAAIKAKYTNAELVKLKLVSDKIKKNNKNITVLPVENIIVKGVNVKFDTPPVIKSGRTLIPVKAISEAFGAKVEWISAQKKVIITKGLTQIVLILDSNKIYVNGVEKTIDVPACSINGRTVVPLGFIGQQLGLKVNWHGDTKDVEIEAPAPTTPPTTTTGSAIVVTGSAIEIN